MERSAQIERSKSVLVVDDDQELLYLLSVKFISAGYRVYGAANGLEALEQMEKHSVDAVVTDDHMPKMNGIDFLSVSRMKWPETPVVVYSGEQKDMAHLAVDRGAFAWIRKGSEFTVLAEFLDYAIQRSVHV
jgi:DNA-binding NtrC family response regulator